MLTPSSGWLYWLDGLVVWRFWLQSRVSGGSLLLDQSTTTSGRTSMRACNKCGETKPIDKFQLQWNYKKINGVKTDIKMYSRRRSCLKCRAKNYASPKEKKRRKERAISRLITEEGNYPNCRQCGDQLVLGSNWRRSNAILWDNLCKPCGNLKRVKHCAENKDRAIDYLGGKCKDCGNVFLVQAVYDFHHKNPEEKDFCIGNILGRGWEKITPELDKCDLLCANCHRIRHHEEGTMGRRT